MKTQHVNLLLIYMFTALVVSFTFGCAPQTITKTEYIATPSYCKVNLPSRPVIQTQGAFQNIIDPQTFASNLRNILIYTDELEMALICCTNSNDCITKK